MNEKQDVRDVATGASGRKIQVRMIVGLGDEDVLPLIAGCMDESIYEIVGYEESDEAFAKMRRAYDAEGSITYQWREVLVTLDVDDLLKHFQGPVVTGEVSDV